MGQNQFMPSTYLGYAVDFDGDGHRDIWGSLPDVFASMANYLARSGWDPPLPLGPRGEAPPGLDAAAPASSTRRRCRPGTSAASACPTAAPPEVRTWPRCCCMDEGDGSSYLVYGNFRALMAWNRSTYFGVSVGLLSDSLRDG